MSPPVTRFYAELPLLTDRAQMTCLVFDYSGRHLHFIDGADGAFLPRRSDSRNG